MPFSPRWLINKGRDDEALKVLSYARSLPQEHDLVQIEFLYVPHLSQFFVLLIHINSEIKAQHVFEQEINTEKFPNYQDGSFSSNLKLGIHGYLDLLSNRSLLVRVILGGAVMFFQQWTGVNAILYYAPSIFSSLGLTGNSTSLLATGVVGIVYVFLFSNIIPSLPALL